MMLVSVFVLYVVVFVVVRFVVVDFAVVLACFVIAVSTNKCFVIAFSFLPPQNA